MTTTARFLGYTDDVTTCECCGRTGLKVVIRLVHLDIDGTPDGDAVHYGTACAARALGTTSKAVRKAADAADGVKRREVARAREVLAQYPALDDATATRYAANNASPFRPQPTTMGAFLALAKLLREAEDTLSLYGLAA